MPKQFLTDQDIEALHQRGIRSLQVGDDVVLTDLAYEKARRLGLQLLSGQAENPPAAPVRPYLLENAPSKVQPPVGAAAPGDVEQRIRSAVMARLGNQVDGKLLDNIIRRVVKATGLK